MAEGLGNALEHVGSQIERGVAEAELELSALRRRCTSLEATILSLRDALEELDPPPTPSWMPPVTAAPEPAATPVGVARDPEDERAVTPSPSPVASPPASIAPAGASTPPAEPTVRPGPTSPEASAFGSGPVPGTSSPVERLHVLAGEAEVAISIPVPATDRGGDPIDDGIDADIRALDAAAVAVPPDARREGVVAGAVTDTAAGHDADEPPQDDDSRFASYMPMLEELWAIARSDDPDDLRGRPTS